MHLYPRPPGTPPPGLRRTLSIAGGCAFACFVVLAPLVRYAVGDPWPRALAWAAVAGVSVGLLLLVLTWLSSFVNRAVDAAFDVVTGRRRSRRRVPVARRAEALKALAATLDAIEAELRRIGWWQSDPPPLRERYQRGELRSFLDAPSFELWLQCVFLPNARDAVAGDALPPSSNVGVIAMRQYDYHSFVPEAQPLLQLLYRFDEQANRYVGHDPLGG